MNTENWKCSIGQLVYFKRQKKNEARISVLKEHNITALESTELLSSEILQQLLLELYFFICYILKLQPFLPFGSSAVSRFSRSTILVKCHQKCNTSSNNHFLLHMLRFGCQSPSQYSWTHHSQWCEYRISCSDYHLINVCSQ